MVDGLLPQSQCMLEEYYKVNQILTSRYDCIFLTGSSTACINMRQLTLTLR